MTSLDGLSFSCLPITPAELLCRYIPTTMYFTRVHVSTRTGAGLLRFTRREWMLMIVAAATLFVDE